MSLAQGSSSGSEEYGLKAATTTQSRIHPLSDDDTPTPQNTTVVAVVTATATAVSNPRPSPPFRFAAPVSRVVTKESLLREDESSRFEFLPSAADDYNNYDKYYCSGSGGGIDNSDAHSLQSSLFEFSLLDPDGRDDGELLALPLPLTSSAIIDGSSGTNTSNEDNDDLLAPPPTLHNLDTYAALLSFESSSIFPEEESDSTTATASSSLAVSTAAAIVASQQQQQQHHPQPSSPPQGQEQQLTTSSNQEVVAEVEAGSVPSLVAIYPDCSSSTTTATTPSATTQPSSGSITINITINNKSSSKTKRASSTRGGSSRSKNNTFTITTRGKKTSVKNPVINNSITMDQDPLDSSMLLLPSPPSPGAGGGVGEAISTQAPTTTTTLIGRKYAPPPTGVVDPTTTSHQYHHNQPLLPPPLASHFHHPPPPGGGGGTMVTRPRHGNHNNNNHNNNNTNMGDHHLLSGIPSPRSSSSSPSENNTSNHHHHHHHATSGGGGGGGGSASENTGRWTAEEHRLFLQGLEQHGKGWKKIATLIQSRTVVQIRTHAQKYFQKLTKAHQAGGGDGGVLLGGGGGGGGVGNGSGMMGSGVGGTQLISAGTAEGDGTVGIAIPLGPDGLPVVSMRTTTHAISASSSSGNDPSSWGAAGAGGEAGASMSGRSRRRASHVSGGGTKRRVIGNVVRSAVREGRNVKRQKIAELKRKGGNAMPIPTLADVAPSSSSAPSLVSGGGGGKEDAPLVPNPLPSVSQILDPYMPPPPPPGAPLAAPPGRVGGRGGGRQQLVHTATHGTLPMAALEDAVFRLLTPATGAPPPPPPSQQQHQHLNNTAVVDPLAPQPNANQVKAPLTHTQYPPLSGGGGGVGGPTGYPQGMVLNYSPTGVTDLALMPSWVDAKNPPTWYNDGSDIDTLLEDADCLNWLSDTGDLDETYPPAMAEPTAVVSSSSTAANSIGAISGQTIASTFHHSTDSLSFLVDPPEQHHVVEDVNQLPSFLDEPPHVADITSSKVATTTTNVTYASATEAVEATTSAPIAAASSSIIPEHQLAGVGESVTNLVGFSDLDMGDEQAFVSALLENSGQSVMSFPKLNSDLHICDNNSSQRNLSGGITEEVPEGKVDEYA